MRQLKYPKVNAGQIKLFHPAMKPFQSLPWIRISQWPQFAAVGVFFLFVLIALAVMTVGHWEIGFAGFIVTIVTFAVAIPVCHLVLARYSRMLMVKQADEDRISFKATEGERHVGIAYCDHSWVFREDTSWDRGFIRIESDPQMDESGWGLNKPREDGQFLCFRGFGPEFRLPLTTIDDTWIAMQSLAFVQTPRLYIRWNHPESGLNTLSLELRDSNSAFEAIAESEELKRWIDDSRANAKEPTLDPVWPFESSKLDFARNPEKQKVEPMDRLMGVLVGFSIFMVMSVLMILVRPFIEIPGGMIGGFSGPVMIAAYSGVIRQRVVKRGVKE